MAAWARNLFYIIILMKARRLTLCHTYSWCPKTSFREHRAIAAFPLSQTTSTEFNLLLCCCFNYQVCDKTRIGISNDFWKAQMIFANRRTGGKKEKKKKQTSKTLLSSKSSLERKLSTEHVKVDFFSALWILKSKYSPWRIKFRNVGFRTAFTKPRNASSPW